jgi:hypothetical protein
MITNQLINPKGDNTMALKAFTDTPVTYEQFLGWVTAHKEADEYRQGVYWEGGKGCAVGCVLHDAYRNPVVAESLAVMDENIDYLEYSEHRLFEPLFGIPRILARLQDRIFEGLPTEDAKLFPLQFAQALRPGIDTPTCGTSLRSGCYWIPNTVLSVTRKRIEHGLQSTG